jgi:putative nucleotidyltransferase with HDIG domain
MAGSRIGRPFLRTIVGRRTLMLFVGCAMAPVTLLAIVAYREVRQTLLGKATVETQRAAKEHAVAVVERVGWLGQILRRSAMDIGISSGTDHSQSLPNFRAAFAETAMGRFVRLLPDSSPSPLGQLPPASLGHLDSGRVTLGVEHGPARVWFVTDRGDGVRIWAEPQPHFLWGFSPGEEMSPHTCVATASGNETLVCSARAPAVIARPGRPSATSDDNAIVATRSIFLRRDFATDDWRVVAALPVEEALAPVRGFGRAFALIAGLALLTVFFLSHVQIRRTTEPLRELTAATEELAAGRYDTRVVARSDDEFGALAVSFSGMAGQIQRQVDLLRALDDVDQAVLRSREIDSLLVTAAGKFLWTSHAVRAVIAMPGRSQAQDRWVVHDSRNGLTANADAAPGFSPDLLRPRVPADARFYTGERASHDLTALRIPAPTGLHWLVLPLWNADRLEGLVALAAEAQWDSSDRTVVESRYLADRLALGLANIHLVCDLDALSVGTLTAFARAIDANSAWTAGHSERVTAVALVLGDALSLHDAERHTLRSGGLLHDIGKIGVPPEILDKAGPLTSAERKIVESHPVLGVRILEPIPAFRDVLAVVRHHHERCDGRGYPDGLRGEEIPFLARLLAVADVYDALVSARPYRAGMAPDAAARIIMEGAGLHLDPHIVQVFLAQQATDAFGHIYQGNREQESLTRAVQAGRQLVEELV